MHSEQRNKFLREPNTAVLTTVDPKGPCELGDTATATKEWRLQLHTHYRGAEATENVVAGDGHLGQRIINR